MKPKHLVTALALAFAGMSTAHAGQFIKSVSFAKDATATNSDNRLYSLYIPTNYNANAKVPLVVTLHGCRQSDLEMIDKAKMHLEAERDNFIVLYPFMNDMADGSGGNNDNDGRNANCWAYWSDAERVRGSGEVHDIKRMVDKVKATYSIDDKRVHITGISSGGGMANIALVAYPDVFASAAIFEGIAYKETASTYTGLQDCPSILKGTVDATNRAASAIIADMRTEMKKSVLRQAPVLVVHNKQDCTVPISVGKNLAATWAGLMGTEGKALDLNAPKQVINSAAGEFKSTRSIYGTAPNGASLLEVMYFDVSAADVAAAGVTALTVDTYAPGSDSAVKEDVSKGHWWTGGDRGPWVINAGPNASAMAWTFFKNHPLCTDTTCPSTGPEPVISAFAATSGPSSSNVSGKASDPNSDLSGVEVKVGTTGTWQAATLQADGSFALTLSGLPNGSYTAYARAKDSAGHLSVTESQANFTIGAAVTAGNGIWNQITDAAILGKLKNAYYYWPKSLPTHPRGDGKRALMLNLHGCSQTAQGHIINKGFNWEDTAEAYGMIVLAPTMPDATKYPRSGTGTNTGSTCWDWFDANHDRTGRDAGALLKLVDALKKQANLSIDPDQVYVSGLSGGAGEAVVLGCVAPDVFRGVAVVETPTLGSPGTSGSSPKTAKEVSDLCQQLAGSYAPELKKQVASVACGDQSGFKPFCDAEVEAFKLMWGATSCAAAVTVNGGSGGNGQNTQCKNAGTGQVVSSLLLPGMQHAWPAGPGGAKNGAYGTWIDNTRVTYPRFSTEFLFANRIKTASHNPPTVSCSAPGSAPTTPVAVNCQGSDDGTVQSLDLTLTKADGTVLTTEHFVGSNYVANLPLDAGTTYNLTVVATDNDNMKSAPVSSTFTVQAAPADAPPVFGTVTGSVSTNCLSVSGSVSDDKGVASVTVQTNGTDQGTATLSSGQFSWNKCGYATGTYVLTVIATDTLQQSTRKDLPSQTVAPATDCFTTTNAQHVTAARAYSTVLGVYANGSSAYLGSYYLTTPVSLKKSIGATGLTVWNKVASCQ